MINITEWIDIPGYEGKYQILISENRVKSLDSILWNGRVLHNSKGKEKRVCKMKTGHLFVSLCKGGICDNYFFHRIVMMIKEGPCPEGMEVCHNDGNPANNHPNNLRYDTRSNNRKDMYKHGTHKNPFILNHPRYSKGKIGKLNHLSIPVIQFSKDGVFISEFESLTQAQEKTGVISQNISQCCKRVRHYNTAGGYVWRFKN